MGDALKMVMQSHGTASGSFTSDEYIGGLSPQRGVEVCCTVELMYSLAYLYMLTGDAEFADHLEMAAFNAFPAAISEDWWSHQYITQMNQPWACELQLKSDQRSVFYDVCRYANVYGLEPEFVGCATRNISGGCLTYSSVFAALLHGQSPYSLSKIGHEHIHAFRRRGFGR